MLISTTQTNGGPVVVQSEQILYLRKITDTATGVVMGAKGFSEFAISVDLTIEDLVDQITDGAFLIGRQTGGDKVAINCRHIRYARPENSATVFVLGSKGGEEFAVSVDVELDEAMEQLQAAMAKARPGQDSSAEDLQESRGFGGADTLSGGLY